VPHRAFVARAVRRDFAAQATYDALLPLFHEQVYPDERGTGPILLRDRSELPSRADARAALGVPEGRASVYLTLGGGGEQSAGATLPRLVQAFRAANLHVVVGAGPLYEGPELRGDGITWLTRYVSAELLPGLDVAVAAAGYNTFHELMFAGVPTVFLPVDRITDDQHARADRAVEAGAGWRVPSVDHALDAVLALLDRREEASAAARALVPHNGARTAARQILGMVSSDADLDVAASVLDHPALARLTGQPKGLAFARELVQLLGGPPSRQASARAQGTPWVVSHGGAPHDSVVDDPVSSFFVLCEAHAIELSMALRVTRALAKKFPLATPTLLHGSLHQLLPLWARFDDWMGVVSLLRALPTQKLYRLDHFTEHLSLWLAGQEDLFDALRTFVRLEGGGQRTVSEVLRGLTQEAQCAESV